MNFFRKMQIKIKNRWSDNKFKKNFLLGLFILTIACLWFPLFILAEFETTPTSFTENMWVFYLFLPIPILSIILGIKYKKVGYKCTKNIVAGFIIGFLLTVYGSFPFIFENSYIEDYSLVNEVEEKINFELPDNGEIKTINWDESAMGAIKIISTSYIEFSDNDEIEKFVSDIKNSDKWLNKNNTNTYFEMLKPDTVMTGFDGESYDLIYIEDLNTYNTLPTESGIYKVYCLTYDVDNNQMEINYYTFEFNA